MDIFIASLLGALLGAGLVAVLVRRLHGSVDGGAMPELRHLRDEMKLLAQRVSIDSSAVAQRLEGIDSRMLQTQSSSTNLARDIFDTLADVRRATDAVVDQAREFSALQDLLRAPTARGGVGEAMLEELLRQVLPPQSYATQHRFRSGTVVDAVVRAGGKLVCIDSKFPLANYRNMCSATDSAERAEAERRFGADVDRHIHDIARRYIIPDEETFDFAVMYVPAEGVYAEILRVSHRRRPLFELAIESRVMPMSPLTMYGYLETILFGLKCLRIEASAQEVLDFCGRLQGDVERFATEYETLGRHLINARSKYEEGQRRLDRFRGKLERVIDFDDDDRPPLEAVAE
ncbi:MAG: DNA recombination protein RmuC [Actinomycetota bacterium]|nr:DNA recombination protein RmuC [Actinomycetota bacterium]